MRNFLNYGKNYFRLNGSILLVKEENVKRSDKGRFYTDRLEILPFGKFTGNNDYVEGDLAREPKPKLSSRQIQL
ncbi:MAG: hypothetical protein IPO32_02355 [Crocinitomicaceae bacterium]|nr:hypothetical protein [Crocinitomicaceae bacterium]